MRICYLGNFAPSHSTETHLRLTLQSLGHTVIPMQEDRESIDDIASHANASDLFLWTRTRGWLNGDGQAMLNKIHRRTASYHLDLYFKISRMHEVPDDPFWRTDMVFTPDGGAQEFFKSLGINHHYLRAGVFDQECAIKQCPRPRDVTFVGSLPYHPEWPYRVQLVDWLRQTYGENFHKFGNPEKTVRGADLNQVYAESKVVVGDTLCPGFNHPYYWSDRVYETVGRGGFIIHPFIKGMQDEFMDGVHLRYYEYGNFRMLKQLIDYYLKHDTEREAIRLAGQRRVADCCTYKQRLQEALGALSRMPSKTVNPIPVQNQPQPVHERQAMREPENLAPYEEVAILQKWI